MRFRGASAENLRRLEDSLDRLVSADTDAAQLGEELFGASEVFRAQGSLRRVVTDMSVGEEAKAGVVREVFGERLAPDAVDLVTRAVQGRWTAPGDLADGLEHLGVVAVARSVDEAQRDRLVDELFAVRRLVHDTTDLRDALADPSRRAADKAGLMRELLRDRTLPSTLVLTERAITGGHRTALVALEEYQRVAAEVQGRRVAVASVAQPLAAAERERLSEALSSRYGRPVHLNEVVDSAMIGGVRVEIGDEVIDGAVSTRLAEARRRLAG